MEWTDFQLQGKTNKQTNHLINLLAALVGTEWKVVQH